MIKIFVIEKIIENMRQYLRNKNWMWIPSLVLRLLCAFSDFIGKKILQKYYWLYVLYKEKIIFCDLGRSNSSQLEKPHLAKTPPFIALSQSTRSI